MSFDPLNFSFQVDWNLFDNLISNVATVVLGS